MRTRHILLATALLAGLTLTACADETDNQNPKPVGSSAWPSPTMSTAKPSSAPASDPVPPSGSANAKEPSKDSGVKACGTFDGKLGPDIPVPNDLSETQLVQLRKDFGASAFKDIANAGVAFVDTVKQAKDGKDSATADDLAKASSNLAKACQAHDN